MKNSQAGFTLIEVLIIAPILMLVIAFMMNFLFGQYGQLAQQGALVNLKVQAQTITFSMQDDVFFAGAFTNTINSNLNDPYQPSGGWSASTNPTVFIISTAALTANHRRADREPVYIDTYGCTPDSALEKNDILQNNIIYFVSGTKLYKRILSAPTGMPTCGTSYLKQTCPEAQASSSCPADRLMTDQLSSFDVTYYDSSNTEVSNPAYATKVKVGVVLADKANAEDVTADSTLILRRINQ